MIFLEFLERQSRQFSLFFREYQFCKEKNTKQSTPVPLAILSIANRPTKSYSKIQTIIIRDNPAKKEASKKMNKDRTLKRFDFLA